MVIAVVELFRRQPIPVCERQKQVMRHLFIVIFIVVHTRTSYSPDNPVPMPIKTPERTCPAASGLLAHPAQTNSTTTSVAMTAWFSLFMASLSFQQSLHFGNFLVGQALERMRNILLSEHRNDCFVDR